MAINDALKAAMSAQRKKTTRLPPEARAAPVTAAYMAESDFEASVEREHRELMGHQKRVREGMERLREMGLSVP